MVVDSDLEVPAALTSVEVRATITGRAEVISTFDVTGARGSACSQASCPLPLSVGEASAAGDVSETASIVVRGLRRSDEVVVRRVRTGFVEGRRLAIPVYLSSSCRNVPCDPASTCDRGACVPQAVDPATLDDVPEGFDPSDLFPPSSRPDAATPVADAAAAMDAGFVRDASPPADTGARPDASPPTDTGARPDASPPADTGVRPDAAPPAPSGSGNSAPRTHAVPWQGQGGRGGRPWEDNRGP